MNTKLEISCVIVIAIASIVAGCGSSSTDQPAPPATSAPAATSAPSPIPGYEVATFSDGGSISGAISVSGPIPNLPKRPVNKDPKVCGTTARDSHQLLVASAGGLRNAVVIVEGVKRGKAVPASFTNPEIDQKNCEYSPHVMVMPVSAEISVRNSDPVLHNIHFYQQDESLFNIAQPMANQVNKQKLEKAGMVYAECDVHGWMQGHVAVVDSPYYAITDEQGRFNITDLPPGTYKVKIWHEYLGEKTQDVVVNAKADTAMNADLKDLLAAKKPAATQPITSTAPASTAPASAAATTDKKSQPGGPTVVVKMITEGSAFKFEPAEITIKVGGTVKWVNDSENRHTATADEKFEKNAGQVILPSGAQPWGSAFLTNGESFEQKFTVPGKYRYLCRNHGQFGMEAVINVVP
jgi:plastocyanin